MVHGWAPCLAGANCTLRMASVKVLRRCERSVSLAPLKIYHKQTKIYVQQQQKKTADQFQGMPATPVYRYSTMSRTLNSLWHSMTHRMVHRIHPNPAAISPMLGSWAECWTWMGRRLVPIFSLSALAACLALSIDRWVDRFAATPTSTPFGSLNPSPRPLRVHSESCKPLGRRFFAGRAHIRRRGPPIDKNTTE